jgi:hypothetical protein
MWRYLPPAMLMVCSALVLIAGATGDLQSWSQSIDEVPSWRTIAESSAWPPVVRAWDSGLALIKRNAAAPADAAPAPPSITRATAAAPGADQSSAAAAKGPPDGQSAVGGASPASARAQAAASPLQQRLMEARLAITAGRAEDARKMLETARAELALRPTHEGNTVQVDMPATWVGRALSSLKSGDSSGALHELDLAIDST